MEVYTQERLLPEPPEEFIKRLTEWYNDRKQKRSDGKRVGRGRCFKDPIHRGGRGVSRYDRKLRKWVLDEMEGKEER